MRKILFAAGSLAAVMLSAPAAAAINVPVPADNYITFGGLDWAWASPCSPDGCWGFGSEINMSYQSTQGWAVATTQQLATGPQKADFLRGDGSLRCASAWFSDYFTHCDYSDGIWNAGAPGGDSYFETWVVRGATAPGVPEPAAWALMIAGFGLVGAAARRRALAAA